MPAMPATQRPSSDVAARVRESRARLALLDSIRAEQRVIAADAEQRLRDSRSLLRTSRERWRAARP